MLLSADYSQIELRVLAHLSRRRGADRRRSASGDDIHVRTAARVFGVAPEQVDARAALAAPRPINFGIIYGPGAFGLARQLGISQAEARDASSARTSSATRA